VIGTLSTCVEGVRWARPDNIHLTLKFLGNVDEARLSSATTALTNVGQDSGSLDLSIGALGGFPKRDRAQIVWVGLEGDIAGLNQLQRSVEKAMETTGFPPEKRAFKTHLTLGRVRFGAVRLPDLNPETGGGFTVSEIKLMRSDLSPGGARYTCLASIDLKS